MSPVFQLKDKGEPRGVAAGAMGLLKRTNRRVIQNAEWETTNRCGRGRVLAVVRMVVVKVLELRLLQGNPNLRNRGGSKMIRARVVPRMAEEMVAGVEMVEITLAKRVGDFLGRVL